MIFFAKMLKRLSRTPHDGDRSFGSKLFSMMEEKETEVITKLKKKIFIYSVVEVVIVLILIAFGTFLFSITLA